ncbi:hypothetical protein [Ponticaulis profundi]|uniref:Sulfotransferase domain-containing protein n=1 Tax=Ponticaulis profundi TaxID=2665222 RepID=A0ABW1SAV7_9PROT
MARTIFHVGTHKTGTTSIQQFAAKNRRQLRNRGLLYPGYKLINRSPHYAHHDFAHVVAGASSKKLKQNDDIKFVNAISANAKATDTVLLSAEPAYRHRIPVNHEHGNIWEERDAYVKRLSEVLKPLDPEICIVLRSRDGFAKSLYQEKVKATSFSGNFQEFLEYDYWYFEYEHQIEIFSKYFKEVKVCVFEDISKFGDDFISGFFNLLGVNVSGLDMPPIANIGFAPELVDLNRYFNKHSTSLKQRKMIRNLLESFAESGSFKSEHIRSSWASEDFMQHFLSRFADQDEKTLKRLAHSIDRDTLFPNRTPIQSVFSGLSCEDIPKLCLMLLTHAKMQEIEQRKA